MTTIHLTDAQRDTFAACDLIVIDGIEDNFPLGLDIPGEWRILTEPCDTCHGEGHLSRIVGKDPEGINCYEQRACSDCVGGRRVVTLTATCTDCSGSGWVAPFDEACDCDHGVVTFGRFIAALLPVEVILPAQDRAPGTNQYAADHDRLTVHPLTSECYLWLNGTGRDAALDPLPRPGQFIARPERVE